MGSEPDFSLKLSSKSGKSQDDPSILISFKYENFLDSSFLRFSDDKALILNLSLCILPILKWLNLQFSDPTDTSLGVKWICNILSLCFLYSQSLIRRGLLCGDNLAMLLKLADAAWSLVVPKFLRPVIRVFRPLEPGLECLDTFLRLHLRVLRWDTSLDSSLKLNKNI